MVTDPVKLSSSLALLSLVSLLGSSVTDATTVAFAVVDWDTAKVVRLEVGDEIGDGVVAIVVG